jgi:hypothetical protein
MLGPSNRLQAPPSKVRVLGKGPVPARVQALLYAFRSGEGPLMPRGVWLVT